MRQAWGPGTGGAPSDSGRSTPRLTTDSPRLKSPRLKVAGHGLLGLTRLQSVADQGGPQPQELHSVVTKVATTLAPPLDTFRHVCAKLFDHLSEEQLIEDSQRVRVLPLRKLPDVLMHWEIPEERIDLFWSLLRKHPSHWEERVLPTHISHEDFEQVLLKFLRRIRDKYCRVALHRGQFVTQNKRQIEEEYIICGHVGKGGFGECSMVVHKASKVERVCKRIDKGEAVQLPHEEVTNELDMLTKLDHPHVVRVYEWFESPTSYHIVMAQAKGGDLKRLLTEAKDSGAVGLQAPLIKDITMQALKALHYVHSHRIMHRDIKPANMLLASASLTRADLWLADFGVSELYEELDTFDSKKPALRGTLPYMAPEVFEHQPTPFSDVWALGVVVYELFAGKRPFEADNHMAFFVQTRKPVKYEPMRDVDASNAAVRFVTRCLTKDPSERLSASQGLQEEWMMESASARPLTADARRAARRMKKSATAFVGQDHFSKVALNVIASQVDASKIAHLSELFQSLDRDHDGRLSPKELVAGLADLGLAEESIDQLVDAMDMNQSGLIDYTEFVAFLINQQHHLLDEVITNAFQVIDVNRDGLLSVDEITCLLNHDGPLGQILPDGKTVEALVHEIGAASNGMISLADFKAYVKRGHGQSLVSIASRVADDQPLQVAFRNLASVVKRSESECVDKAVAITEMHWITTIGELRKLRDDDWPRLRLPLKLETALRAYVA